MTWQYSMVKCICLILYTGRYSDEHLIEFFKEKLKSMPCQNQGYVLDGFPKTEQQAIELFASESPIYMMYMYVCTSISGPPVVIKLLDCLKSLLHMKVN